MSFTKEKKFSSENFDLKEGSDKKLPGGSGTIPFIDKRRTTVSDSYETRNPSGLT